MVEFTDAQVDQYWDNGYLFPVDVMSAAETKVARSELEQMEQDWLAADLPRSINQYKRANSNCVIPLAAQLSTNPAVLDVIEKIIGPDILIWGSEFLIKEPGTKHMISMHQDLTYWGMGSTDKQVTAWIALSPATKASGCMDFVQGSHKNEILPHKDTFADDNMLSRGQEIEVDVAEADKVAIELQPGQMSLHHGLTIHGSGPNVSDDRRIAFVVRYIAPDVQKTVGDKDYAMLARGQDVSGNFLHYAEPKAYFEPRALGVYEDIREAQRKALAQGLDQDAKLYATTQG